MGLVEAVSARRPLEEQQNLPVSLRDRGIPMRRGGKLELLQWFQRQFFFFFLERRCLLICRGRR
jgi:hypothetical protein